MIRIPDNLSNLLAIMLYLSGFPLQNLAFQGGDVVVETKTSDISQKHSEVSIYQWSFNTRL